MSNPNLSFSGLADIYLKPYGVAAAARAIGSVSKCEVTHTEDQKTAQNYGRDGGVLNTFSRLTKIGLVLTLQSVSKENLALALRGSITSVASGSVTDEVVTGYTGSLVPLAHMNASAVVVTNSGATVTYVEGTDYTVTGAGIIILASGAITDGQSLKVDYTHPAQDVIEARRSKAHRSSTTSSRVRLRLPVAVRPTR